VSQTDYKEDGTVFGSVLNHVTDGRWATGACIASIVARGMSALLLTAHMQLTFRVSVFSRRANCLAEQQANSGPILPPAVHSKSVTPQLPQRSREEANGFKFDRNRLSFHSDQVH